MKVLGVGDSSGGIFDTYFKEGRPYKNYNLDKQGKGQFWAAAVTRSARTTRRPILRQAAVLGPQRRASEGTARRLAQDPCRVRLRRTPVPSTEITMAPEGTTKVNLPPGSGWTRRSSRRSRSPRAFPARAFPRPRLPNPCPSRSIQGRRTPRPTPLREGARSRTARSARLTPRALRQTRPALRCEVPAFLWRRLVQPPGHRYVEDQLDSTTGEGGDLPDGQFGADQQVEVRGNPVHQPLISSAWLGGG